MAEEFRGLEFERPIVELESKIAEIRNINSSDMVNLDREIKSLEEKRDKLMQEIYSSLTPWQRVQLARHPKRPYTLDYLQALFTDFNELHGDRCFGDDSALVGGCAFLDSMPVIVLGQQKGRSIEESTHRNFGMMHPEGYRKALRLMKMAEKFHKPVIVFIDTSGAYPGIGAEERGQAEAIARNLREMAALKTQIIGVIIGEGGSGGALGIGITDRMLMLENSWYSVISPEGCASILFHDATKAANAAEALKLTATDLLAVKVIDEIVPEPLGGAHRDFNLTVAALKERILKHLKELKNLDMPRLLANRYEKFRRYGVFLETADEKIGRVRKNASANNGDELKKAAKKPKEKIKNQAK